MLPIQRAPSQGPDGTQQVRYLLTLLTETKRTVHQAPDVASVYLNQAIALLVDQGPGESGQHKCKGGMAQWQVTRIDEFIKAHLHHCIRTSELASLLGLSVSHFSHAFKQATGVTPLAYVAGVRVEAARQQLLSSTRSLSEIAHMHGFCDQSHFCSVFRRETGLAPQAWRKLHVSVGRSRAGAGDTASRQAQATGARKTS